MGGRARSGPRPRGDRVLLRAGLDRRAARWSRSRNRCSIGFSAQTSRAPDEVLWRMDHLGRECTVQTAAINAAMAGCCPSTSRSVLAAWDAVMRDRAAKGGGWQSTSGPAPLIIVNGPIRSRARVQLHPGGIFAAGFRPNATIPRALGLMLRNAFGVDPDAAATRGSPVAERSASARTRRRARGSRSPPRWAWSRARTPSRPPSLAPTSSSTTGTPRTPSSS